MRLVNEVNEQRNPRTNATVNQLMARYLELLDVEDTTQVRYEIAIRKHIKPLLGKVPLAKLSGETIEEFYKTLRTCRDHCGGRKFIEHAQPPKRPTSNPHPPTLEEATAIVNEAFKDLSWGMFAWLAMTSGARWRACRRERGRTAASNPPAPQSRAAPSNVLAPSRRATLPWTPVGGGDVHVRIQFVALAACAFSGMDCRLLAVSCSGCRAGHDLAMGV